VSTNISTLASAHHPSGRMHRRRRHSWLTRRLTGLLVAGALSVTAACGGAEEVNATGAEAEPVVIAWNSTPDVTYLPLLMAVEAMKEEGYNLKAETLSGADVVAQALATDRADLTYNNVTGLANAVEQGVPIRIISSGSANDAVWMTAEGYEDCSSLTGEPVGIFGPAASSGYTKQMNLYFSKHCPDVKPRLVTIPDSALRAQALANGEIVATTLVQSDAANVVEKLDPSGKYSITPFRDEFTGLADNYIFASQNAIENKSEIVTAFLKAELEAVRQIYENPSSYAELLEEYLPSKDYSIESAKVKLESKSWYPDGDLNSAGMEGLDETLQVFELPGTADALVDRTILDRALEEIDGS
jgi:ABC-type nitrate/sulfonate/bicarbonate transport system substrate-binding protein